MHGRSDPSLFDGAIGHHLQIRDARAAEKLGLVRYIARYMYITGYLGQPGLRYCAGSPSIHRRGTIRVPCHACCCTPCTLQRPNVLVGCASLWTLPEAGCYPRKHRKQSRPLAGDDRCRPLVRVHRRHRPTVGQDVQTAFRLLAAPPEARKPGTCSRLGRLRPGPCSH